MNSIEAKELTDRIFELIRNSESIEDLVSIEEKEFENKYRMDSKVYPKIDFDIKPSDLNELVKMGIFDTDFSFRDNITKEIKDPLSKLLYALAWKNGDLKKLKHIAKGINEFNEGLTNQQEAFVFYQFGKYLTKTDGQPIIDQHVIRAFLVSVTNELVSIEKYRNLSVITKKEKEDITRYIDWLKSDELSSNLKSLQDYTYYIDKILFATGKKIKAKKLRP